MGDDRHDTDPPTEWTFDESTLRSRAGGLALDATQAMATPPGVESERDRRAPPPFGPYTRIEVLAEQGSIGLVAKGYNEAFGRWELLKFLRAELASELELVRQFKREGRVLAQLSHPNVVQVFATYQVQGRTCLAMEFLEGRSLAAEVADQGGALPIDQGLELMLEAARGLSAAHEAGLCHRDIKPDNLFVTQSSRGKRGGLKLIDFGLATAARTTRSSLALDPALISDAAGGTPLYMAPELWLGHEAGPASDLYALGLSFYFAFTGRHPIEKLTLGAVREQVFSNEPFPGARSARPELPAPIAAIIDRLIEKSVERRFASADELVAALVAADSGARPRRVPGSGPYRGLAPFSAAERDVFFGRDREIAEVAERLRARAAVVLVGPSGSGKSSLALAGVAPAIEDGVLGGGLVFRTAVLEPHTHPLRSLSMALAPIAGVPDEKIHAALVADPGRLGELLRGSLKPPSAVLLVVDQLEELATLAPDPSAAHGFARALASLVESSTPAIRVLATVRADLMDRLFSIEPLRALLAAGFFPVRPLLGDALERALVEPARAAGFELEDPAIAAKIVADVARTTAGLPLMSFAMAAWWEARDTERRLLPSAAWSALGGLAGALARHADSVLAGMGPDERRAAEQILVRLVTADGARAVVPRATLEDPAVGGSAGARALARLLSEKLVVESAGDVELVHEALVSGWPALAALLALSGEDHAFHERMAAGAREWEAQGRPDGALWDGEQAARLLAWFERSEAPLGQQELAFVEAVRRRAQRRRFLLRSLVAAGLLLVLVLALVTKASERRLAAELDHTRAEATSAHRGYVQDTRKLLERVALLDAELDPAKALAAALRSRELGPDNELDTIAWQARLAGVPQPLPRTPDAAALVAWLPDGARVVTASAASGLRLLDADGAGTRALAWPAGFGRSLSALAAAGSRVAVGDGSGAIVVIKTGGGVAERLHCKGTVRRLAWKKDGRLVATCGELGALQLSVLGGKDAPRVLGEGLRGSSLDADGAHAAVIDSDGALAVIDTDDASRRAFKAGDATVTAVALSPDASMLVAGDDRGRLVRIVIPAGGRATWSSSSTTAGWRLLEASPDGTRWLGVDDAHHAVLFDAALEPVARFGVKSALHSWLASRRALAVAVRHDAIRLLAEDTGTVVGRLAGSTQALVGLAADKDGHWLVASSHDGGIRAWSLDQASVRVLRGPAPPATRCEAASDGSAVACLDAHALHVEPTGGDKRAGAVSVALSPAEIPAVKGPFPFAIGSRAATAAWLLPGGNIVRLQHAKPAIVHDAPGDHVRIASGRSGSPLAVAGDRNGRHVLMLARTDTEALLPVSGLDTPVTALAFSHDDANLVVGDAHGAVWLVDVPDASAGAPLAVARGSSISAVALAQDGTTLAAAAPSGQVWVEQLSGKTRRNVFTATSGVRCLVWSTAGRGLIVGTAGGRVWLVDSAGTRALSLLAQSSPVQSCVRNPGDDRFTFVTENGMVWQRDLDLSPIWMAKKPADALDPHAAALDQWKGLGQESRSP